MTDTIRVTSERKGGNPGGRCDVQCSTQRFAGYFKYCHGSNIRGASTFRANHQPLYEAITFQLVREWELSTTDFYVLLNQDRQVQFLNWRSFMEHDPAGRDFYFVSKISPLPNNCPEPLVNRILEAEEAYLDSVLVADIIGKAQNYRCCATQGCSNGKIIYLDLGCSFVYAKEGFLTLPHRLKSYDSRVFREQIRKLERTSVRTLHGKVVNLGNMVATIKDMNVPTLHPFGRAPVSAFLSPTEIHEIEQYIAQGMTETIPAFKARGLMS